MPEGSIVLLRASLKGMGREAECDILVRKSLRNQPNAVSAADAYRYSECSVISAPTDLPDGEYRVVFEDHVAKVKKESGTWVLREPVSRFRY